MGRSVGLCAGVGCGLTAIRGRHVAILNGGSLQGLPTTRITAAASTSRLTTFGVLGMAFLTSHMSSVCRAVNSV